MMAAQQAALAQQGGQDTSELAGGSLLVASLIFWECVCYT
jgi:hypothetical protein